MSTPRALLALIIALLPAAGRADDWLPVTPEELQMTSEPKAPRAPAIYLHFQFDRDDEAAYDLVYVRLKVLTEEGRKYGNVEIPFDDNRERISGLAARTIRPDGSIIRFDGTVYETPLVKAHGVRYLVKSFALPDVQVGSILEYRYKRSHSDSSYFTLVYDSKWILNSDLFIKHGHYSLAPNRYLPLTYSAPLGLPEGLKLPGKQRGRIRLETHDVPAFVAEEYMPPEDEVKQRIDFVYGGDSAPASFDEFWGHVSREMYESWQSFVAQPRAMDEALQQIVAVGDTPETKLRKIYARAQRIRNLSYEREKTSEEDRREKLKSVQDAADVWQRGYGNDEQINMLFYALARAAGLSADGILVATRDVCFFKPQMLNISQFNASVVRVTVDGVNLYFDPGTAFVPFGFLPWPETGIQGLVLASHGGGWISTPMPPPTDTRVEHRARLQLSESGSLEGRVTVTYTGLESVARRSAERLRDAAGRKRDLESALQRAIPVGSTVELTNQPDWDSSTETLVAEFKLTVPAWMLPAGSRRLVPAALFGAGVKDMFAHAERLHPIYFDYPSRQDDDVTITLPAGLKVDAVPDAKSFDLGAVSYRIESEGSGATLHQTRQLALNGPLIQVKFYDKLYDFFQSVRHQDEQQVVLARSAAAAAH